MSDITSPKEYIEYYKKIIFPIRTIRKKLQSLLEANNNHSKNTAEKLSLSLKEKIMNTLSGGLIQDFVDTMAILANEREKENPDIITSKEREMRERIVNNILPFGYDLSSKLFELASEKNQYDEKNIIQITKKSVGSKNREFLGIIADGVGPLGLVLFGDTLRPNKKIKVTEKEKIKCHIRISLFKKYLGLGGCEKILKNSDYEPTIKKSENTKYYDFSEEYKSEIIGKLKARYPSFDKLVKTTNKKKEIPLGKKTHLMHLGNYTCGVGDGKNNKTGKIERYISYWDIWDLDPFGNDSAYNINKFCFPFEIYGRIRESDINEIKN